MADINLNLGIVIHDINIIVAIDAFLAAEPMPQIVDPDWVDPENGSPAPMIDQFSTTKEWVEVWLSNLGKRKLLKNINKGIDILNRQTTQSHLTEL